MNENKQQLIERWDTFLSKIKSRSDEMILQAIQGTEVFIPQILYDTNAVANAWRGIKSQIDEMAQKVFEAWMKMENLFHGAGSTNEETNTEIEKRFKTISYIKWEYEKNKIIALAKAARQILFNVKNHVNQNKLLHCTQCGSPLDISIYSFRAKNIKCESCDSVNTFKPDERILALENWVLVPLADEHVLEEKEREFFLQESFDNASVNNITQDMEQELVEARKASIAKYYQFLIDSIPEKAEFYIRQRDQRLKHAFVH